MQSFWQVLASPRKASRGIVNFVVSGRNDMAGPEWRDDARAHLLPRIPLPSRDHQLRRLAVWLYHVLGPPLSGSRRLGLSEDAGGCDVGSCGLAVDVALLRGWFGLARVGRELTRQDVVGEPCQTCGHRSWIGIAG